MSAIVAYYDGNSYDGWIFSGVVDYGLTNNKCIINGSDNICYRIEGVCCTGSSAHSNGDFNTVGDYNIYVEYKLYFDQINSGTHCYLDWNAGSGWINGIMSYDTTGAHHDTYYFPSSADNNNAIKIRFRVDSQNDGEDNCYVNDIYIKTATPSPTTPAPVTSAPVTSAPVTSAPVTLAPVTSNPVTAAPVTFAPVTSNPTTSPVTNAPVSSNPTASTVTSTPITSAPVTDSPVTNAPVTSNPTSTPVTPSPFTSTPVTSNPTSTPVRSQISTIPFNDETTESTNYSGSGIDAEIDNNSDGLEINTLMIIIIIGVVGLIIVCVVFVHIFRKKRNNVVNIETIKDTVIGVELRAAGVTPTTAGGVILTSQITTQFSTSTDTLSNDRFNIDGKMDNKSTKALNVPPLIPPVVLTKYGDKGETDEENSQSSKDQTYNHVTEGNYNPATEDKTVYI